MEDNEIPKTSETLVEYVDRRVKEAEQADIKEADRIMKDTKYHLEHNVDGFQKASPIYFDALKKFNEALRDMSFDDIDEIFNPLE